MKRVHSRRILRAMSGTFVVGGLAVATPLVAQTAGTKKPGSGSVASAPSGASATTKTPEAGTTSIPGSARAPTADIAPATSLPDILAGARKARCYTALCFGKNDEFGLEPLVELPIGKTFAITGHNSGALGAWIDSHDLSVSFSGGLRFWFDYDMFSVSLYFSEPLNNLKTLHVAGSSFDYPASNIRRPYPGIALGFLGDTLWLGFDYQDLVNGDTPQHADPNYPLDAPVSQAVSVTIGLATITAIRNGIGAYQAQKNETPPTGGAVSRTAPPRAPDAAKASSTATKPAPGKMKSTKTASVPTADSARPTWGNAPAPVKRAVAPAPAATTRPPK